MHSSGARRGNQRLQPSMLSRVSRVGVSQPSTSQAINLQRIRQTSSSSSLASSSSSSSSSNSMKSVDLNYQEPLIPPARTLSSSSSSLNTRNSPAIMLESHSLHRQAASMLNVQRLPPRGLLQRIRPSNKRLQTAAKWAKNGAIAVGAGGGIAAILHLRSDSHDNVVAVVDDGDIKNSDNIVHGEKTTAISITTIADTTMKPERDTPIGIDIE